jgi:hypothetical protein
MTKCGGCRRFLEKMTSYMQASGASWNSLGYNSLYMLQKMTSYMQASGASWNSLWYNSLYMRSHLTKSYICHFQGPYLSVGHDAHYGIIVFFLWQILVYCLTTPLTRIFRAWGGGGGLLLLFKRRGLLRGQVEMSFTRRVVMLLVFWCVQICWGGLGTRQMWVVTGCKWVFRIWLGLLNSNASLCTK